MSCGAGCFAAMMAAGPGAAPDMRAGWGVKVRDLWSTRDLAFIYSPSFSLPTPLMANGGSALLTFTWQPAFENAMPGPLTIGDPHSTITLNPSIQPRNQSTIPGYEKYVEQCGEFVYRVSNTQFSKSRDAYEFARDAFAR
jgi:hypothetical protein